MVRWRLWAVALAGIALLALGAHAQTSSAQSENEDVRFTFHRVDEGYLRLDGRTGQVSSCTRRPIGWLCQAVPDERTALESEIMRLQLDNAALKRELLTHSVALPSGVRPDPPGTDDRRLQMPSDAEFDRMMAFIEKVWRRLVDMIVTAQRDVLRKS